MLQSKLATKSPNKLERLCGIMCLLQLACDMMEWLSENNKMSNKDMHYLSPSRPVSDYAKPAATAGGKTTHTPEGTRNADLFTEVRVEQIVTKKIPFNSH